MVSNYLLLEEPIRMASILEPSKPNFFPAMTKIIGTLGPNSRSVEVISGCLKAGMSVARFDFSWGDAEFHQETLENLKVAIKTTKKLCAVMLDTGGPELLIVNKSEHPITLEEDSFVILTPDQDKEATSNLLPINFSGLSKGMIHFDEILQEADGIILARGNLGIDLPPEKVFLFQKQAVHKCNMAGKPAVVTRVVDSMTDNLRPTRAEATDVANIVLDGSDAILLGAETLRGLYPVEAISIVGRICAEAEKVYNQDLYFRKAVKCVGQPMSHIESIASSAVRAAIKVKASVVICFTSSGRTARLIAKYRPTMPVLSVVIPRLKTDQLRWTFTGAFEARQSLIVRGLFPMLADARHPVETTNATNESILKVALDHGQASGIVKPHDRVVVCQKVGDASVVKIIELEN
ncbi:Pyruvate kinase, cytosolic [Sesamum angolense]|uniref:pyruvate kinase n=1 Tax=Sesamum angolense TaxID=2727404 RepID=A0AAE1W2P7_9LAMI|nr:Pyruvate kinase, cytosolic [Sesamum angolense]